ncbi:MAG TPA: nucleotide-binding domain containing protein, partial [Chloroflexota bacterium]|nr:nucleotide-binding domain containing protein [Chloroflexota bacterium]
LSPVTRTPGLGLILTGGETALAVCQAMGGTSIEVLGEALPGAPLGVLRGPGWEVPLATKSGGFGAPDALLRTAEALLGSLG